jgi:hypothetical protein
LLCRGESYSNRSRALADHDKLQFNAHALEVVVTIIMPIVT